MASKISFWSPGQVFYSPKNRIQYTKGLLINLNNFVNKLQKVNPECKGRPSTKEVTFVIAPTMALVIKCILRITIYVFRYR